MQLKLNEYMTKHADNLVLGKCVRNCLISNYYNIPFAGIPKYSAFSPNNVLL